jgi:hypothetical protein
MRFFRISGLLLCLIIVSCSGSKKEEGSVVNGKFQNATGVVIILRELDVDYIHDMDSVTLDEQGLFRFRINQPDAAFYILKSSSGEYILLLLEKEEEVNVLADLKKQPFDFKVIGSPGSILLKDFYDRTYINLAKVDSLRSVLMDNRDSPTFYQLSLSFDSLFLKLTGDQKNIEKTFILQNPNSLASLIVLNYKFGMKPVLTIEEDFPIFQMLDSTLQMKYPANKHVAFHHKRVVEHQIREREKQSLKKLKF